MQAHAVRKVAVIDTDAGVVWLYIGRTWTIWQVNFVFLLPCFTEFINAALW